MRTLILLILCAIARIGSGQQSDTLYSEDEMRAFVKVKISSQSHGINVDSIAMDAALLSGISMTRLGEILRQGIDGKPLQCTESEKSAIAAFNQASVLIGKKREEHIKSACQTVGISYEKYLAMSDLFRSSIPFQQKLVPYFEEEIKNR